MTISEFSIKRPVTTIMVVISMVVMGALTLTNLKAETLPAFNIPVATVVTTWSGASPEDVEKLITYEIEDALTPIEGITSVKTESTMGRSLVIVEFEYGEDIDQKVNNIVTEVNRVKGELPDDIDEPIVRKAGPDSDMVMMLSIVGEDQIRLKSFAENVVKPRFERIEGAGEIRVRGGLEREILIEIDPDLLEGYGLNILDVYSKIRSASINLPAGTLREGDKEFLVRVFGEVQTLEDVRGIVVNNDGSQTLFLTDIADVRIDIKDIENYGRTNGIENVIVNIEKSDSGNVIDIANTVREELKELELLLPEGTSFEINRDASIDVVNSINSVKNNALTGLILASVILLIFLKDIRATLVVAIGIPVSVIATFTFFGAKGMTLNLISLMGLSLGVGMLVDNSIVVLDNIYRHLTELKKSPLRAAADGASEMVVPLMASTATTVAVFIPIIIREGLAKEIFHDMSWSITASLIASLIIAVTFVPMVCSRLLKPRSSGGKDITSEGKILTAVKTVYIKILKKALNNRIATIIVTLVMFVGIMGAGLKTVGGGFFPVTDDGVYTIVAEVPSGMDVGKVNRIAKVLEEVAVLHPATKTYTTNVSSNDATVVVDVGFMGDRNVDDNIFQIVGQIRKMLDGKVMDANVSVVPDFVSGTGSSDLTLVLRSDDMVQMEVYSRKIQERMNGIPGLVDITNSLLGGNPETRIILDRKKLEYYGISVTDLTFAVSYQIRGGQPVTIKTGVEEIDVTVQLRREYRESADLLMDVRVATAEGGSVRLRDLATLEIVEGASGIEKQDRIRKVEIDANISEGYDLVTSQRAVEEAIKVIGLPNNIRYSFGGEGEDLAKVGGHLIFAFMIAIFLIYFILASQFESFALPFIVMGSVPLSVMGVYSGLMITGENTDVMVFVGIIMLAGIVVNNAIVLIDYMNLLKSKGKSGREMIIEAGSTRLRPIVMTTMTTVFGMIPLSLGIGQGSETYKGLAIAVIFGLSFSTLLTLIYIPVQYSIYESILNKVKRLKRRKTVLEEQSI